MAHLLGTPSLVPDALPRPLTYEEQLLKKKKEEEWYRRSTATVYYSQTQYTDLYYKKADFSPNMTPPKPPKAEILYSTIRYANEDDDDEEDDDFPPGIPAPEPPKADILYNPIRYAPI